MDRIMTVEERIKKAEEIYNRRRNNEISITKTNINEKKTSFSLFKKMIIQILVCLVIYSSFYLIKNRNYFFSETVINKTSELLRYDINFEQVYKQVLNYIDENKEKLNINLKEDQDSEQENIEETTEKEGEKELEKDIKNEKVVDKKENNSIKSKETKNEEKDVTKKKETTSTTKTQMEIDAEYVKKHAKFIKPLEGEITSGFRKKRSN